MPAPLSAGILLYRRSEAVEVLLIRPGGPFWRNKQVGAWMIPKGGIEPGETASEAAVREFEEELGHAPKGAPVPLCTIRQAGGKWVEAFALEGEFEPGDVRSIDFEIEWPPRSRRFQRYPEVEEARWMGLAEARRLILPSQLPIIDALEEMLSGESSGPR